MKGRVKGLLAGTTPGAEHIEHTEIPVVAAFSSDPNAQRQALQVLTLAQRTADEHVASAHRQAEKIANEARATAEQIIREAESRAEDLRRQADKSLADARGTADQIARDAQRHAEETRKDADEILTDARTRAEEIAKDAQTNADELKDLAEQKYQDVVGSLATRREALQKQIEALESFDQEYRSRLTTFMQNQLRALWVDEPHVDSDADRLSAASTSTHED
jgi:vacuolar-type H+-ATPase subunit H